MCDSQVFEEIVDYLAEFVSYYFALASERYLMSNSLEVLTALCLEELVVKNGCSNIIAVKRPQMIITQTIEKRDFFINLTKKTTALYV